MNRIVKTDWIPLHASATNSSRLLKPMTFPETKWGIQIKSSIELANRVVHRCRLTTRISSKFSGMRTIIASGKANPNNLRPSGSRDTHNHAEAIITKAAADAHGEKNPIATIDNTTPKPSSPHANQPEGG